MFKVVQIVFGASTLSSSRWISQDEALINCFWPTKAAWEAAQGSRPMPTASAARDFIGTPMPPGVLVGRPKLDQNRGYDTRYSEIVVLYEEDETMDQL